MINIVDDFLEPNVYQEVYDNLFHNQFQEVEVGDIQTRVGKKAEWCM